MQQRKTRARSMAVLPARARGGASVLCPLCGAASRVVYTRRHPPKGAGQPGYVYRLRVCENGHKFPTNEEAKRE